MAVPAEEQLANGENGPRPELDEKYLETECGMTVDKAYRIAMHIYREQERERTVQIDYHARLRFIALSKQAKYGTFKEDGIECGWFDLVGNDAKKVWRTLDKLTPQQAMLEFIRLLDAVCPTFRTQIGGEQRKIEQQKLNGDLNPENRSINNYLAKQNLLVDPSPIESQEILQQFEQQRRQIQEALNKQTYHQFLAYAQQTHPGEPEKQEQLIRQLQEQHYQQYMSQVYAQAQAAYQAAVAAATAPTANQDPEAALCAKMAAQTLRGSPPNGGKVRSVDELAEEAAVGDAESDVSDEEDASETPVSSIYAQMGMFCHTNPKISPATMWTTKNLQEFKDTIKKDGPEGILKIGHGETVTVRVPTHPEGNSLFWEFCTDYYDLGFGVYFEWTVAETNQVTVHVDESGDEYDEEEGESGATNNSGSAGGGGGDVEAEAVKKQQDPNKPRIDEIIPTFRRDCHEEVFFGSHVYPGRGVYLLKFDNSYSLWRSKTLYYRVFYSK